MTVAFDGPSSCPIIKPGNTCTLKVVAQANDPDGDPLRYQWSGCASGTASTADCFVDRPGPVEAIVAVSDDHAHTVSRATTATGVNRPPDVFVGYLFRYPMSSVSIGLYGDVMDPDEGFLCGRQYCETATASGACRLSRFECTCLAGLEADVVATAPAGLCTVTFGVKDSWGQIGTPTITFDVSNPRPLSASPR